MRTSRLPAVCAAVATAAAALTLPGAAQAAGPAYTVQSLHFSVHVGPGLTQACDVVGDLYTPAGLTGRAPSILTTNGFGGSAADQTPFAETYASDGYVVLSYSGLGFGGSGCKITLDDPDYDGQAASQLVGFLGGQNGVAFTDAAHTMPVAGLSDVIHDARDHHGVKQKYDPRVGMWGGSYGGEIQFAAASVDPRVDALNPQITWNDLAYSLDPNNTNQTTGVTTATPGATKTTWAGAFSAIGVLDGAEYGQADPQRNIGCPNFADFVCPALVTGGATGYLQPDAIAALQHASVATYLPKITIPVLLDQGEVDTLFNLSEAIATYQALKAQGTPVSMMWRYNGHSGGTPSAAGATYEAARIKAWFDHYLKGASVATGPAFAYYTDWNGQVATSSKYPVGTSQAMYLSGTSLTNSPGAIQSGSQTFVTPAAGPPTGLGGLDAVGGSVPSGLDQPDTNTPGTFASWTGPALTSPLTVVGQPLLNVSVSAPVAAAAQSTGPAGQLVLFAKIYDVAPDGTQSLINGLVAPVRIPDVTKPVHIVLPGIAHRFEAGHHVAVYLSGGDVNYRGGVVANPVTITTGSASQALYLPAVASSTSS